MVVQVFCLLFLASTSFAAPSKKMETPAELKAKALQEYQQLKGKPLPVSTDASVTGLLTLEDPKKKEITRPWKYYLGLKVQNFQASGTAGNELGESFNMGNRPEAIMPGLEFGTQFNGWSVGQFQLSPVVHLQASYTNQNAPVTLKSGFLIEDAYLNTAIVNAGLGLNISSKELPALQFEMGYRLGALNYTQASTNNFANFSESAEISIFQTSVLYSLNSKWALVFDRHQRQIESQSNQIEITPISYELGTRIKW